MQTIKYIDGLKAEYSISLNAYEYSLIQLAFAVALDNGLDDKTLENDMQKLYDNKPIEFNEQKFAEAMTEAIKQTMIRTVNVDESTIERIFRHEI